MNRRTNFKIRTIFLLLSICFVPATQAQFWKKLKKKVENKVEEKIDKEANKLINGTSREKEETNQNKQKEDVASFGNATISHSVLYGTVTINLLTKTTVEKTGNELAFIGYWDTFGVDIQDGYYLKLENIDDLSKLQNKTFSIPNEAYLRLDYDALVKGSYNFDQKVRAPQQGLEFISGTVSVTFNKDTNVVISFNGEVKVKNHNNKKEEDYSMKGDTPATISGTIKTNSPAYTITKERKEVVKRKEQNSDITESDKAAILETISPTVNIPDSFSFSKRITLETTNNKGEKYPLEFLFGDYPDIYAMSVAPKEMQGQGKVIMVMTPKSSTMFMEAAGMKMKKSTSLEAMGNQYDISEKLPERDGFEYRKTGNTKTILGYNCHEYKVNYNYTNSKGSASFWVARDFPIQNVEMPILGMKMNNPYFQGFVLELNSNHQGENWRIKATNIADENVNIKTSAYKNMGY